MSARNSRARLATSTPIPGRSNVRKRDTGGPCHQPKPAGPEVQVARRSHGGGLRVAWGWLEGRMGVARWCLAGASLVAETLGALDFGAGLAHKILCTASAAGGVARRLALMGLDAPGSWPPLPYK